jgi:hypothetical protein
MPWQSCRTSPRADGKAGRSDGGTRRRSKGVDGCCTEKQYPTDTSDFSVRRNSATSPPVERAASSTRSTSISGRSYAHELRSRRWQQERRSTEQGPSPQFSQQISPVSETEDRARQDIESISVDRPKNIKIISRRAFASPPPRPRAAAAAAAREAVKPQPGGLLGCLKGWSPRAGQRPGPRSLNPCGIVRRCRRCRPPGSILIQRENCPVSQSHMT